MPQKNNYRRHFIILQEDEQGYALASDKQPSGYAKLETKSDKCKVSYYVQNLKKENGPYYMGLICNKKDINKIIVIGELNIDDHGRTDITYEYPVEDVAATGISVDKILGAAVIKLAKPNVISILCGFSTNDVPQWKKYEIAGITKKEELHKDVPSETKEINTLENPTIADNKENTDNEGNTNMNNDNLDETPMTEEAIPIPLINVTDKDINPEEFAEYEKDIETSRTELEFEKPNRETLEPDNDQVDLTDEGEYEEEPPIESDVQLEQEPAANNDEGFSDESGLSPGSDDSESRYINFRKHHHNEETLKLNKFFRQIIDGYEELEDICEEIKRCKWFKVPVKSPDDMYDAANYTKYTVVYYPMTNYYKYIKKYKHFMLGLKYDRYGKVKYLVYAVPGTKAIQEQPFGGKSGFVSWVPLKQGEEFDDSFGYWLMFYDFRNSTIVIPIIK